MSRIHPSHPLQLERRFFLLSVSSLIASTLFSSCASSNQSQQANQAPDITTNPPKLVRIGLTKGSTIFLILKAQKTLEERLKQIGTQVQWFEFQTIPLALEAVNAGSLDFSSGVDTSMVFAQANGVPFVYTSAMPQRPKGLALIVNDDSPIHTLADFKGKKVGYGIGWSLHYFLVKALESVGLTVDDIQSVKITGAADGIAALKSRSIDVFAIWDPFYASAEKTMKIRTIVDGQGFAPNRGYTLATPSFAKAYPEVVKVILEKLQAAGDWANQNQRQASEILSPLLGMDVDTLEITMKRQTLGIIPMGEQIIKEQQEIADVFFHLKLISKQIRVEEMVPSTPQWVSNSLTKI